MKNYGVNPKMRGERGRGELPQSASLKEGKNGRKEVDGWESGSDLTGGKGKDRGKIDWEEGSGECLVVEYRVSSEGRNKNRAKVGLAVTKRRKAGPNRYDCSRDLLLAQEDLKMNRESFPRATRAYFMQRTSQAWKARSNNDSPSNI